jgi:hypothetical protein
MQPANLQQVSSKLDHRPSPDRKAPRAGFSFDLGETDMRIRLGLIAAACALVATPAFGQRAMRVPASVARPSSPVVRENPAMASGFSPIVAAALLDQICKPARDELRAADKLAMSDGLRAAETPANLRWALPEGARVWKAQSLDSEVYVYAYGPKLTQCGIAIVRPLRDVIALKLREQLTDAAHGYAVENEQKMQAGVRFTRFKAAGFRYADLMDYPTNGDTPGVLKVELLPLT